MDSDGDFTNDQGAGSIYLFAETIEFLADAIVTTSQTKDADGVVHQIILAANTIDYQAADDLQILSDGDGANTSQPGIIYVLPLGGIASTSTDNVFSLLWQLNFVGTFFQYEGNVHFNGGPNSDLLLSADGINTQIGITGEDIIFDGNDLTIRARGQEKHEIVMGFLGTLDGEDGLTFNGTGKVNLNVRGQRFDKNLPIEGGDIQVQTNKIKLNAHRHSFKAQGPKNRDGNGGTIFFTGKSVEVDPETKVRFLADASETLVGNAQVLRTTNNRKAITFGHGSSSVIIGKTKGTIQFSANGGGQGGNAGAINIFGDNSEAAKVFVENRPESIQAKALGPIGNGGFVNLVLNSAFFIQDADDSLADLTIAATGGTAEGVGGQIIISKASGINGSLDVNAIMKVDGGPNTTGLNQYGLIQLNDIFCFQSQSGFTDYPKTYWQCNGSTSGLAIATAANTALNSQLKAQLASTLSVNNPVVHIYSMDNISQWDKFFAVPNSDPTNNRVYGVSNAFHRVSAAFDKVFIGISLVDASVAAGQDEVIPVTVPTIRQSTILHELGHQFDLIWGFPTNSSIPPNPLTLLEQAVATDEAAAPGINFDSGGTPLPCNDTFNPLTCSLTTGPFNFDRLQQAHGNNAELFSNMFSDIVSDPHGYQSFPELDRAMSKLPATRAYIEGLISPPVPTPVF